MRILLLVLTVAFSCNQSTPSNKHVSILVDITQGDQHQLLSEEQLKEILGYSNEHLWHGTTVNVRNITEAKHQVAETFSIADANQFLSNETKRVSEIKTLLKDVTEKLESIQTQSANRKYSQVIPALKQSLQQLSEASATEKHLLVYSDLMHHSEDRSWYKEMPNKDEMRKIFAGLQFNEVNITFIYAPKSYEDLIRFEQVAESLKLTLELQGATVTISTQNQES